MCWHDTEGQHFVQTRCSRNRLWSRTPLCWFNTLHVRVFRKFAEKNSKSQNVCWNLFWFFLKYTIMFCFYFLEDSAKFHRNIPYVLYALKMCVFPKYSEKNSKSKNVCWHDTEGKHFVQARCSRNRLWSRTPLCWFNTCMSACLENLQKKILSPKMCVDLFLNFFLKYTKVSYFYFLEDSGKFHRNIPYVLYALKMCVFPKYSEKHSKSKNVCWHDTEGEHFVQARCSRNRLWSRTPLCWFNTLHVRVFRKFAEKNSKYKNVCWNFIDFFF